MLKKIGLLIAFTLVGFEAEAACPAHQPAITATIDGKFRICPGAKDKDGVTVPADFYKFCTVKVPGQTDAVVLNPVPDVPVLIGFPGARYQQTATATCTNKTDVTGGSATSAITFRYGDPAAPALSE